MAINKEFIAKNSVQPRSAKARGKHHFLYLTDLRSSQQEEAKLKIAEAIRLTKLKMRGQLFKVRAEPPMFCKRNKIAIFEFDENDKLIKIEFSKIGCNSWTCPRCNILKALRVKYQIKETAILNDLGYFLTLTLDPKKIPIEYYSETRNDTHKYITKIFNTFVLDIKRKTSSKEKLKYTWIMEFQKNGRAHMHILLNNYIDINLIRKIWVRVGGGHIMDIQPAKTLEGLSRYLSDYVVKGLKQDITDVSYFKYFEKRFSISQSCIKSDINVSALLNGQTIEEKIQILEELGFKEVYNALITNDYEDKLIYFEDKK